MLLCNIIAEISKTSNKAFFLQIKDQGENWMHFPIIQYNISCMEINVLH